MDRFLLGFAVVFALIGAVQDARYRKIPNRLTYFGFVAALLTRVFMVGWPSLKDGLIGTLFGGGLFFFLFAIGGMGAGDVKLMAAVSAWVGGTQVLDLLIATAFAGGAMAVGMMFYRRKVLVTLLNTLRLIHHHLVFGFRPHPELNVQDPNSMRIPFAPAIAVGALYCFGGKFLWG